MLPAGSTAGWTAAAPGALGALARAALSGGGLQAPLGHGLMCHDAVGGAPWFALAPQALSPKATLTVSGIQGRSPWENFEVFEVGE